MKLFSSALAIGLLALSGVSQAAVTVTDWDVHGEVEFGGGKGYGAFTDIYTFTLPTAGDISSSAVSLVLKPKVGAFLGDVTLFSGTYGGSSSWLGAYKFGPNTALNFYSAVGLLAGDYFYQVTGSYAGLGGTYAFASEFTSTAVPVPEPETYALLALGLGCIAVARRSRAMS